MISVRVRDRSRGRYHMTSQRGDETMTHAFGFLRTFRIKGKQQPQSPATQLTVQGTWGFQPPPQKVLWGVFSSQSMTN